MLEDLSYTDFEVMAQEADRKGLATPFERMQLILLVRIARDLQQIKHLLKQPQVPVEHKPISDHDARLAGL